MSCGIDSGRLLAAYEKARRELLALRVERGYWVGELASSALSTATAVSALTLVERHDPTDEAAGCYEDESRESQLSERIVGGIQWLADHQNEDGGWGDTPLSYSNIATTMLAMAAFHLTGVPADHADLLTRADAYLEQQGRVAGIRRRYGRDKTFAVPILTNGALAGLVEWNDVAALPFELACLPQRFYRFVRLPVVSYAIPALVAIGQTRFYHQKPWNPLLRWIRARSVEPSLEVLRRMQPESGGYLEAIPLTSFVVMSLASMGRVEHPVTRDGVRFLLASARADGSWPIDTNLATWNTTLALNALAPRERDLAGLAPVEWLLGCQHRERHPFTGAEPGGWGWSDLSGAVPDADDTPGALLGLAAIYQGPSCGADRERIAEAARAGVDWLLGLQNRDGGWPTFCRGWGKLPFDRSGTDLTAHALRALSAWIPLLDVPTRERVQRASQRGWRFLDRRQRPDGSWVPLWFGNQDDPREENPVYGTSKVLAACRDLQRTTTGAARRGYMWLTDQQREDGGWGGGPALEKRYGAGRPSSTEETALALEAMLPVAAEPEFQPVVQKGLEWLVRAVETNRYLENSPIGFYFAKLWYHEKLYPIIFTVSALGQALCRSPARSAHPTATSPPPAHD